MSNCRMVWAALLVALGLTGCVQSVPVKDTVPSPTEGVAEGNFQLRLHQTQGDKAVEGRTGLPPVSSKIGAGGRASGCTLTSIGKPPKGLKGTLKAGDCEVTIE